MELDVVVNQPPKREPKQRKTTRVAFDKHTQLTACNVQHATSGGKTNAGHSSTTLWQPERKRFKLRRRQHSGPFPIVRVRAAQRIELGSVQLQRRTAQHAIRKLAQLSYTPPHSEEAVALNVRKLSH